jgi:NADPH:quinone reductase-like Zn-dependent oxidoreductase
LALFGLVTATATFAVPVTSQAIVQGEKGLVLQTVPTPKPGAGQVLIKFYAAGVNPMDWKRQAQIPGFDVAGVIDSVGAGVRGFKPGDAVLARVDAGYAQYAVATADETVGKPRRFTIEQAAGVPVAGTAGYRAVEEAKVERGQRVAIIGAAGGTGKAAVRVARSHGAKVIAVGRSSHQAFLKTLGVDEFVAFDTEDVGARVRNVDAAINLVDGQANATLGYVRRGGRFTSVAGAPSEERAAGVGIVMIAGATYNGISAGDALRALTTLAEKGEYTVTVSTALPLEEAGKAQEIGRSGQSIGKIVLVVDPAKSMSR